MGRYFVNLSRLDMSLVIQALEYLKENVVIDMDIKEDRALCVLIDLLKKQQDGQDPKTNLVFKNSPQGCAKIFDIVIKN